MDSALSIEHLEHWEGWSIGRGGALGGVEHWEGWSAVSFIFDHQFLHKEGGRGGAWGRVEC